MQTTDLTTSQQSFIAHFGEMGSRWGINRTVGQIYALLYINEKPLCADEIGAALQISRSNVSMGLKELDSWRLTRVRHIPGDRKDYFTVPEDIWEIVRTLVEERKKREIDPTLSMLRDTLLNEPQTGQEAYTQTKMQEMHDLIEMLTNWHDDIAKLSNNQISSLLNMGAKIYKLYELRSKLNVLPGGKAKEAETSKQ